MTKSQPLTLEFIQNAILNPLMNQKCCDLHPGTCLNRTCQNFIIGAKSFTKLYVLFLLAQFVFTRRRKILNNPKQEFKRFAKSLGKSLLFSGGYLAICRAVICLITKYYAFGQFSAISSATLGGTSLIFEPPERQPQIALFIFTNTLQTLYTMAKRRNYPVKVPHGSCVLYIISISVICYHYMNNKESLRKSYKQIFDKVIGDI